MLFQELSKIKRSSIMTSIILVAVGIVMIMCPAQYVDSLVSVLGYGMVIFAAVMMLNFISAKKSLINYIKFAGALVMMLLGISVLVFDNIVLIIGIVFGLILIGDGILTIINTVLYVRRAQRKGWWFLVLLSVLMIAAFAVVEKGGAGRFGNPQKVCEIMEKNPIKVTPIISHRIPFDGMKEFLENMEKYQKSKIKVMVEFD